jgi:hypothetical protein
MAKHSLSIPLPDFVQFGVPGQDDSHKGNVNGLPPTTTCHTYYCIVEACKLAR